MTRPALTIALLEDDETLLFVLGRALEQKGHTVYCLENSAALQQLLSRTPRLDLVVLDLKLQNETSLGLIADVRQACPDARILMMTAYASIATTVEAIKNGADDYLPKPVNAEDILRNFYTASGNAADTEQAAVSRQLSPRQLEWEHIQRVLQENNGNISQTARQLNMHRRTLQRKLQKKPSL